ncbi:MAG: nitrite reductase large subunit [Planctomycetes bacterium]|nr:nitrite reductase large subunit [Planctomycetota bacterium]
MAQQRVVVVGNGMVGHRFVAEVVEQGLAQRLHLTVLGEEPRPAYDRVHLSEWFGGRSADDLSLLPSRDFYAANGVDFRAGAKVAAIDRTARTVTCADGSVVVYDQLVLATGSRPFVPPLPGADLPGCLVYRTIEDLEAIKARASGRRIGVVVGGGLLGLEAANAIRQMGLETHVVEFAPRLMAVQIDDGGSAILRRKVEALGVRVHTSKNTQKIEALDGDRLAMRFADGASLETDLVLFSAGVRPRDELAKQSGLAMGTRGGIAVDDACRTSDPAVFAIGECAAHKDRCYGLVAPGYRMAEVAVDHIAAASAPRTFTGADLSTKLKLLGVDVGSIGDAQGQTPGSHTVAFTDSVSEVYRRLVLSPDRKHLIGAILVGDGSLYGQLLTLFQNRIVLPEKVEGMITPQTGGGAKIGLKPSDLPDTAQICSCNNVSKGAIVGAIRDHKYTLVGDVISCTKAGTGCGSCKTLVKDLLHAELKAAGVEVTNHVCEHFKHSRQELYHLVRVHKITTFGELIARHGSGTGCDICKPAVASILASAWNEPVIGRKHAHLQDTNDRFLANLQRDGTYSVVPRCPGGEITPDQLIALGQVAKKYRLYSKITGGQRVDLFGARVEQLPAIWEELIAVGFESGHAYGKSLRTVKSCVGTDWCRYGVQDSVGLAVKMEHRYKGLRSPHKLKSACSGCARECAEAQGKDFGVIATEKGYNLYVCGNGGMKPQHGVLLAGDISEEQVLRYTDRFLMFYIRTADRLERTASWFNKLEGGIEYLRKVVIEDSLGICAELEAEMAHVVATYQDEWATAVKDPEMRKRFRTFINTDAPDPSIVMVPSRSQHRPAFWEEKERQLETVR